jgi:hypothetical protein
MLQTITQNGLFSLHRHFSFIFILDREYLLLFFKIVIRCDGNMKINLVTAGYTNCPNPALVG